MQFPFLRATLTVALLGAAMASALAQTPQSLPGGDVLVPTTSVAYPQDRGFRAHTNHLIFVPHENATSGGVTPYGGLGPGGGMTPAQVRSFYAIPPNGGAGVIAIVDAYHYPTALADFNKFCTQFGLPKETSTNVLSGTNKVLQVVYANGSQPAFNLSWSVEEALDIQWAHAMAPNAKIVLVEAKSNSYTDLLNAVTKATTLAGVKQISLSWGGDEFSGVQNLDSYFPQNKGCVYFASSGDVGGVVSWPSSSPNVIAVGGTRVNTNSAGAFVSETAWIDSGGGVSAYIAKPSYQNGIPNTPALFRGVPDIAAIADPNTGASVYHSSYGWLIVGGTSLACPVVAGLANAGGSYYTSPAAALSGLYSYLGGPYFRDITSGSAGAFTAVPGWDFITGVGAPL